MPSLARLLTPVAVLAVMGLAAPAVAQKGEPPPPKPKIDCSKKENRTKPECGNRKSELDDDELFYAGYWLARKGDFALAAHYLRQARNEADPRILTYLGYSLRKLGRAEEAMRYYTRALAANPDYVVARAYMGEAFLEQGQRDKAAEQLAEIERRCGTGCIEYRELAEAMAKHG
jgi:tetratricopeptide (TPR) repeat protein